GAAARTPGAAARTRVAVAGRTPAAMTAAARTCWAGCSRTSSAVPHRKRAVALRTAGPGAEVVGRTGAAGRTADPAARAAGTGGTARTWCRLLVAKTASIDASRLARGSAGPIVDMSSAVRAGEKTRPWVLLRRSGRA